MQRAEARCFTLFNRYEGANMVHLGKWRLIGAGKFLIGQKEVTNEAYWRPKIRDWVKRGHQWSVLAPENSRLSKKRSPMKRIGARKFEIGQKEVTNEAYWRQKIRDWAKRGHQGRGLALENSRSSK
jgi:hypothetical protein